MMPAYTQKIKPLCMRGISDIEKQCNKILERIRKAPERLQKASE